MTWAPLVYAYDIEGTLYYVRIYMGPFVTNNPREDDAPECHGMAQISGQSTFPNLLSYQLRGVLELSLNPSSPVLSAQVF